MARVTSEVTVPNKPRNPWYHRLWFAIIAIAVALELTTLLRGRAGETMSSYVRGKVQHPVMRALLGGLLGWLLYHWVAASTTNLNANDLTATLIGIAIGLAASRTRLR